MSSFRVPKDKKKTALNHYTFTAKLHCRDDILDLESNAVFFIL